MIKLCDKQNVTEVLEIWLEASIQAHGFIPADFWKSKLEDMENIYLPNAETWVHIQDEKVLGFLCLVESTLAAIFVHPQHQGIGIGSELLNKAKERRNRLELCVYRLNEHSLLFYKSHGFQVVKEQVDETTGQAELLMRFVDSR